MAEEAEFQGASAASAHSCRDKAFEIFVKRTITSIQKEAWGRSKEVKEIREACQGFLNTLDQNGCTEETLKEVLYPLQLACSSNMVKVVELALGCLHKLVAHAWLHGESTASGTMDMLSAHGSLDDDDTVANVIKMVIKCGETNNEALQLAVVRALLTFTTAEHFIAHGECLLAAVRAVFNLALGSENPVNKRTACNALLQMLNTICKRVTQIQPRLTGGSECSSRTTSDAFEIFRSTSSTSFANMSPKSHRGSGTGGGKPGKLTVQDKDVLLVLTAFCKLASREAPGSSGAESVLAQGKLLALEMLAKVLSSSHHNWDHVPEPFCRQLRQPLCLALLRNCATSDPVAYALALRLLVALLCLPRLRAGLRAELGAFYPLLVLRCLEQQVQLLGVAQQQPAEREQLQQHQANVVAALGALQGLLVEPQLLVDLYVNFDCDLQASNLYERTVQALSKLSQAPEADADGKAEKRSAPDAVAAAAAAGIRKEALACCLQVVAALESWARPIKEAALRAAEAEPGPAGNGQAGFSSLPSMERDGSHNSLNGLAGAAAAGKSPAAKAGSSGAQLSEAERLAAAKSTKDTLGKGISLFNSKGPLKGLDFLMSQGLLESSPAAVAAFLRAQSDQLDKAQLGELLGHHEDFAIAVMHGWIDSEPSMAGQAIDQSLRRLLGGFRLPGEAQKIDRIMEKFAERYCKDNPGRFGNADAAYVLSFAIIMLNTDAHNPLAERRLAKADFVAMNQQQGEEGGMSPVLPAGQLEEIFDRVVRDEILVRGEAANRDFASSRTSTRNRLAAAMGWTSLLQPFRALAGGSSSGRSGRDSSNQAQRRYLQEMAEREVVRAAASGNVWCSASHPEHVRPMLQVGGPMLLQALSAALTSAPDAAASAPLLAGLLQLARLFGLLGLDWQCEQCVAALSARCGVFAPAAAGSVAESKQLAVLQALLGLTAGPEAGFLGSSWLIVLRCVSALDALKHELTRPAAVPAAAPAKEASSSNPFSRMFQSMFGSAGGAGSAAAGASPPASAGGGAASSGGRFSIAGAPGSDVAVDDRDSLDGSARPSLAIRDAPGAGLVLWAESAAGALELERPYARSATLDGDAVVVFMRALCAVSQEELESGSSVTTAAAAGAQSPGSPGAAAAAAGGGPRLFSLQKVVECAYANMSRIRLVWHKLWAVIAAQLVGASCHPHRRVALYAVDSLRQLVAKLLARAELEHFTHQEEALRPFVAVLRQCDEACVRELAVQCVMQAVASHPRGLGSGWRMVILALRLGAADPSPAQLAAYEEAGGRDEPPSGAAAAPGGVDLDGDYGWGLLLRTLADVLQHDRRPQVVDAALEMVFGLLGRFSNCWDAAAWRVLVHRVLRHMLALPPALQAALSGSSAVGQLGQTSAGAGQTFGQTTADARGGSFSGFQPMQAGQQAVRSSIGSPASGSGAGGAVQAGLSVSEQRAMMTNLLQRMDRYYPLLCEQAASVRPEFKVDLVQQLAAIGVSWYQQPSIYLSTAGIKALMRLAETVAQISGSAQNGGCGWALFLEPFAAAVRADVDTVIGLATRQLAEQAADQQQQQHMSLLGKGAAKGSGVSSPQAGGVSNASNAASNSLYGSPLGPKGGAAARQAVAAAASRQLLASQLRVRTQQLVLMQRALASIHKSCKDSMSWEEQMQLLGVLALGVDAAIAYNTGLAGAHWEKQQRRLSQLGDKQQLVRRISSGSGRAATAAPAAAAAAATTQQQQQQDPQLLSSVPEGARQLQVVGSGSLSDTLSLASAVSRNSSLSMSGLVGFGSYLQPNPSSGGSVTGSITGSFTAGSVSLTGPSLSSGDGAAGVASGLTSPSGAMSVSAAGSGDGSVVAAADKTGTGTTDDVAKRPSGEITAASPEPAEQQQQQQQASAAAALEPQQQALAPIRTDVQALRSFEEQQQQRPGSPGSSSGSPSKRLAAAAAAPGSPGRTRMAGMSLPLLMVSSAESVEEVHPALMRLEAEGGMLLIEALNLSLSSCTLHTPATSRARLRLLQLVRSIIQSEAACSTAASMRPLAIAAAAAAATPDLGSALQLVSPRLAPPSPPASLAELRATPAAVGNADGSSTPDADALSCKDNPLQDALAGGGWEHAARAPLVVAALKVLSGLQGNEAVY
ncbi:hypothetical protein OEZ85_003561 [Tetradesmus obliquus]|uniref:SEC7 domain-containing protein n=1 Tax=Tetradesmus obliquus TaxID=3088 RepID=A0ABY8UGV1_TETOB|nr:hypothetical protein OEZ85_003561 [Tetradesmus obliquus]